MKEILLKTVLICSKRLLICLSCSWPYLFRCYMRLFYVKIERSILLCSLIQYFRIYYNKQKEDDQVICGKSIYHLFFIKWPITKLFPDFVTLPPSYMEFTLSWWDAPSRSINKNGDGNISQQNEKNIQN